jgi:SAM-dependent methyltransferase
MDFWDPYYTAREPIGEPSTFARWCVQKGWVGFADAVVDAGCGDGRDSVCFASRGAHVVAVDAAESAVRRVRARGLNALCVSMAQIPPLAKLFGPLALHNSRVVAYSRFSLHAVTAADADLFLAWAARHADVLLVETRSVNDPRYGVGEPASDDAFIDGHYRRFTRLSDLTTKLRSLGFQIEFAAEEWRDAQIKTDLAVVNRIVATRGSSV